MKSKVIHKRLLTKVIAITVTISFLCQNVVWLNAEPYSRKALAPSSGDQDTYQRIQDEYLRKTGIELEADRKGITGNLKLQNGNFIKISNWSDIVKNSSQLHKESKIYIKRLIKKQLAHYNKDTLYEGPKSTLWPLLTACNPKEMANIQYGYKSIICALIVNRLLNDPDVTLKDLFDMEIPKLIRDSVYLLDKSGIFDVLIKIGILENATCQSVLAGMKSYTPPAGTIAHSRQLLDLRTPTQERYIKAILEERPTFSISPFHGFKTQTVNVLCSKIANISKDNGVLIYDISIIDSEDVREIMSNIREDAREQMQAYSFTRIRHVFLEEISNLDPEFLEDLTKALMQEGITVHYLAHPSRIDLFTSMKQYYSDQDKALELIYYPILPENDLVKIYENIKTDDEKKDVVIRKFLEISDGWPVAVSFYAGWRKPFTSDFYETLNKEMASGNTADSIAYTMYERLFAEYLHYGNKPLIKEGFNFARLLKDSDKKTRLFEIKLEESDIKNLEENKIDILEVVSKKYPEYYDTFIKGILWWDVANGRIILPRVLALFGTTIVADELDEEVHVFHRDKRIAGIITPREVLRIRDLLLSGEKHNRYSLKPAEAEEETKPAQAKAEPAEVVGGSGVLPVEINVSEGVLIDNVKRLVKGKLMPGESFSHEITDGDYLVEVFGMYMPQDDTTLFDALPLKERGEIDKKFPSVTKYSPKPYLTVRVSHKKKEEPLAYLVLYPTPEGISLIKSRKIKYFPTEVHKSLETAILDTEPDITKKKFNKRSFYQLIFYAGGYYFRKNYLKQKESSTIVKGFAQELIKDEMWQDKIYFDHKTAKLSINSSLTKKDFKILLAKIKDKELRQVLRSLFFSSRRNTMDAFIEILVELKEKDKYKLLNARYLSGVLTGFGYPVKYISSHYKLYTHYEGLGIDIRNRFRELLAVSEGNLDAFIKLMAELKKKDKYKLPNASNLAGVLTGFGYPVMYISSYYKLYTHYKNLKKKKLRIDIRDRFRDLLAVSEGNLDAFIKLMDELKKKDKYKSPNASNLEGILTGFGYPVGYIGSYYKLYTHYKKLRIDIGNRFRELLAVSEGNLDAFVKLMNELKKKDEYKPLNAAILGGALTGFGYPVGYISNCYKFYTHWQGQEVDIATEFDKFFHYEGKGIKETIDILGKRIIGTKRGFPEGKFELSIQAYIYFVLVSLGKIEEAVTTISPDILERTLSANLDETTVTALERLHRKHILSDKEYSIGLRIVEGYSLDEIREELKFTKEDLYIITPSLGQKLLDEEVISVTDAEKAKPAEVAQMEGVVYGECVGVIKIIPNAIKGYKDLFNLKDNEIAVVPYYPTEDPTFTRPMGIISSDDPTKLSHAEVRARFWSIPHVAVSDINDLKNLEGKWVYIKVSKDGVEFRLASQGEIDNWESFKAKLPKPKLAEVILTTEKNILQWYETENPAEVSYKFANLNQVSKGLSGHPYQRAAFGSVIPYATYKRVLDVNVGVEDKMRQIIESIDNRNIDDIKEKLSQVQQLIENMNIPEEIWGNAEEEISEGEDWSIDYTVRNETYSGNGVFVRTGTNAEDLPDYPGFGVGQYGTFPNVMRKDVKKYVKKAWASVWNLGAYLERQKLGIDHFLVFSDVQIVRSIGAEYAFVIHTANVDETNTDLVVLEIVQGLGEGLVSDKCPGKAHKYVYDKKQDKIVNYEPATKKQKIALNPEGGTKIASTDYSQDIFLKYKERSELALDLARAAVRIEKVFNRPQDIEGAIERNDYYKRYDISVCQSRSQVGYDRYPAPWEEFYKENIDWARGMIIDAKPYFNNVLRNRAHAFFLVKFRSQIEAMLHNPGEIELMISRWLRLFYSIEPDGKNIVKLIFANCLGIHNFLKEALQMFDSDFVAKILDVAAIDTEQLSQEDYIQFCETNGFMISYLVETCINIREIINKVKPTTLIAIINELNRYYHDDSILNYIGARYRARDAAHGIDKEEKKQFVGSMLVEAIENLSEKNAIYVIDGLSKKALKWLDIKPIIVKRPAKPVDSESELRSHEATAPCL